MVPPFTDGSQRAARKSLAATHKVDEPQTSIPNFLHYCQLFLKIFLNYHCILKLLTNYLVGGRCFAGKSFRPTPRNTRGQSPNLPEHDPEEQYPVYRHAASGNSSPSGRSTGFSKGAPPSAGCRGIKRMKGDRMGDMYLKKWRLPSVNDTIFIFIETASTTPGYSFSIEKSRPLKISTQTGGDPKTSRNRNGGPHS